MQHRQTPIDVTFARTWPWAVPTPGDVDDLMREARRVCDQYAGKRSWRVRAGTCAGARQRGAGRGQQGAGH